MSKYQEDLNYELFTAVDSGESEICESLIKKGADVDARNSNYHTPLYNAAHQCNIDVVKVLLKNGASVNYKSQDTGETPLHAAAATSNFYDAPKTIKELLEHGANIDEKNVYGYTPLKVAISANDIEAIKTLITWGANVDEKDNNENSILHSTPALLNPEIVKILVENGANPNAKNNFGSTPLHSATSLLAVETVEILLKNKAEVNAEDKAFRTPLMCSYSSGSPAIAKLLVRHEKIEGLKKALRKMKSPLTEQGKEVKNTILLEIKKREMIKKAGEAMKEITI
jgi:ankyrin repeat protein